MGPKHKRLKREGRLQAAKHWLPKYDGKNIVKGYRKHFGVSMVGAALELQMLGYEISAEYIEQLKRNEADIAKARERKKRERDMQEQFDMFPDSDENFYYIAGYTSGGAPYGVTWEEMGMESYGKELDDDELPF